MLTTVVVANSITVALDDVMRCADQILAPLFSNFNNVVDAALLEMHRMSFIR